MAFRAVCTEEREGGTAGPASAAQGPLRPLRNLGPGLRTQASLRRKFLGETPGPFVIRLRSLRNLVTEPRNYEIGTKEPGVQGALRNGPLRNLITEPRNYEIGFKEPGGPGPLRKRESCEVGNAISEVRNQDQKSLCL